jgi:hypothetical protein
MHQLHVVPRRPFWQVPGMKNRMPVAVVGLVFVACVAQVRDLRTQKPFWEAPAGTKIALVSVEVPPWAEEEAVKAKAGALLKEAALAAFPGPAFTIVDQTGAGAAMAIWPDSKPIIQPTAPSTVEAGRPCAFGADGAAHAVGAPPIAWSVKKAPAGFAIDGQSGRVTWTPARPGSEEIELIASNARGETSYRFDVSVVAPGAGGKQPPKAVPAPSLSADQAFGSTPPPGAPDAPLLLGVQLVGWHSSMDNGTPMMQRRAFADVVFALTTRSGVVETTRVRLDQVAGASFRNTPVFVPDRASALSWGQARRLPVEFAPFNEEKMRTAMATMAVAAFAYPYGEHPVEFSVQLDESSPALKEGIALSDKSDFEGAYKSFEKVSAQDPQSAGALYDMGVMREAQGRDADAAELYKKAIQIKADGMYQRQLDVVERRMKQYRPIALEKSPG